MRMTAEFLHVRKITVTFAARTVLHQLSLDAARGEVLALIGPNGAGKTTLLRAIAGLLDHEGTILLEQTDLRGLTARQRGQTIAYLPQTQGVHWPMRVFDIVALGRLPHRTTISRLEQADKAAVEAALEAANLQDFRDRRIDTLSAGEAARVLLARALSANAPLLLADEPIAALDPYHQIQVMELLRTEAQKGAAVIAVLHDLRMAAQFADRIALLHQGTLAAAGTPAEVLTPERLEAIYQIRQGETESPVPFLGPNWIRV